MDNQSTSNNQNTPDTQYPQSSQYPPGYQYPPQYQQSSSGDSPGKSKATASLVLGLVAMFLPIPFLDVAAGVTGLILAVKAKREGFSAGLRTAGLVLSIIGTIYAIFYTLFWIFFGSWYLNLLSELFYFY